MIAVAVYLNGKKLTVAGTDDLCVLNAIVNAVGELGKSTVPIGKRGKNNIGTVSSAWRVRRSATTSCPLQP